MLWMKFRQRKRVHQDYVTTVTTPLEPNFSIEKPHKKKAKASLCKIDPLPHVYSREYYTMHHYLMNYGFRYQKHEILRRVTIFCALS